MPRRRFGEARQRNGPARWLVWRSSLARRRKGSAHKKLSPLRNAFVMAFHARHAADIACLDKCSLFSPDDRLVTPYDAGRFSDRINME